MEELLRKEKPGVSIVRKPGDHGIHSGEPDPDARLIECLDQLPVEWAQPSIPAIIEFPKVIVIW
jgi:hypothetical protein